MGVVNPETGAISNFLWVAAQEGSKTILEAVSSAQAAINPDYAFIVESNLYRPTIENMQDTALVNIRIGQVTSKDETNFDMTQTVTFYYDCYVLGRNEDNPDSPGSLVPADEVAVQRLHYLCAMVFEAITNLANFYSGLGSGQIVPGKVGIVFNPVEDPENSATPYAPAQITFTCDFPYEARDLRDLPEYKATFINLGSWASRIFTD